VKPAAVVNVGIAGARNVEPGTIVIGSESIYCDLVDSSSTIVKVERLRPDPVLFELARLALPDARAIPIATAARVGGGHALCDVEAMEGFGVLRAAAESGVPALELRAISNRFDDPRVAWRLDEALDALARAVAALLGAVDA
jgi:nucleoside phosphorylase